MTNKTLIIKKSDVCDNFSNKILTFKCQIEDGKIVNIKGYLEVNNTVGGRTKINLDWEVAMYQEKFYREFEELLMTTKKSITRRCVFN